MEGETQTLKNMLKFNDNYLEFTRKTYECTYDI